MGYYSDFLFAQPSFREGVGRVVDFGGFLDTYNVSPTPGIADTIALRNDWLAVGEYIRSATASAVKEVGLDSSEMKCVKAR